MHVKDLDFKLKEKKPRGISATDIEAFNSLRDVICNTTKGVQCDCDHIEMK